MQSMNMQKSRDSAVTFLFVLLVGIKIYVLQ